jgi:hypothetical protein|tara:strand:- start:47022 stop:48500 length:1479 start_codon:yes stop_codon:yes gene_type:complete
MNKSLLLIICDFLLISVLALVKFDPAPTTDPVIAAEIEEGVSEDLMELLQNSLEIEAIKRAQLEEERTELAANLTLTESARSKLSAEKENLIEEKSELEKERERLAREKAETSITLSETRSTLESTSEELELTARERERLAAERSALAEEKTTLTENLANQTAETAALKASLDAQQAELHAAQAAINEAQAEATRLAEERASLATSLEVAQSERAQLDKSLQFTRDELSQTRAERTEAERRASQLATDLTKIAQSSEAIQAEIKANQPISSNEIFRRYEQNRINISMTADISGLLGTRSQTATLDAVAINSNGKRYIIFEESRAPFRINNLDQVVGIDGSIMNNGRRLPITRLSFLAADPRLIVIELMPTRDPALLSETFSLSTEPFRFQQAVLISHTLGAYGLTDFRLLPGGEGYVGVDRNLINQLTGEFQPNRGDYIFAQSGELLGIMVESQRGILINDLTIGAILPIGDQFRPATAKALQPELEAQLLR